MFVGFPNSSQVRHETRNKPTPEASYTHTHTPQLLRCGVSRRCHHVHHCLKQDMGLLGSNLFPLRLFCYTLFCSGLRLRLDENQGGRETTFWCLYVLLARAGGWGKRILICIQPIALAFKPTPFQGCLAPLHRGEFSFPAEQGDFKGQIDTCIY